MGTRVLQWIGVKKKPPQQTPLQPKPPAKLPPAHNGLQIEVITTFHQAKKETLTNKSSDKADILQKLDVRDKDFALDKAFKETAARSKGLLDGHLFIGRCLSGLDCLASTLSPDKYKADYFMRNSWLLDFGFSLTPENLLFIYHLGLLREMQPELPRPCLSFLVRLLPEGLKDSTDIIRELNSGQNLLFFMRALNFAVGREMQRYAEVSRTVETEKAIERAIELFNTDMRLILKGQELIEVIMREKAAEKRVRVIRSLIRLGRFIHEVEKAFEKQSASELGNVIYELIYKENGTVDLKLLSKVVKDPLLASRAKAPERQKIEMADSKLSPSEKYEIVKEVSASKGRECLRLLLDVAVFFKLNPFSSTTVREVALLLIKESVAEMVRSSPEWSAKVPAPERMPLTADKIPETSAPETPAMAEAVPEAPIPTPPLLTELVDMLEYKNELTTGSEKEVAHYRARNEVISDILLETPEALPLLLEKHATSYSGWKSFLESGNFNVDHPATQIIEPLIDRIMQTPQGEVQALEYFFGILSRPEVYSLGPKEQLRALKKQHLPVDQEVRRTLLREMIKTSAQAAPLFAERSRPQEIRENIIEIAKANALLTDNSPPSRTRLLNAIMLMAVKVQQFTELVREGKFNEALARYDELEQLDQSKQISKLRVPDLDLLKAYLEGARYTKRTEHSSLTFMALKSVDGHIPTAKRVLETLKEDRDIYEEIRKLAFNLSLNIFNVQYASCFLAQRFGHEDRTLENLRSILAEDKDGEQLLATIKKIPQAIQGQSPNIYDDAFVQINESTHVLDILVLWNLINTRGLDHRLDRQDIAAKIIEFIKTGWGDEGALWNKILTITEAGKYHVVNEFFRRMLKNIVERARTMDLVKGKAEGKTINVLKDPFLGFKGEEYKAQIGMAIRANEETIHRTYKDPL